MVLCEEILQWLTEFGHNPSRSQVDSKRVRSFLPVFHPDEAPAESQSWEPHPVDNQTSAPYPSSKCVKGTETNYSQGFSEGIDEWKLLGHLSRELGKSLGDEGCRSSPLSPSDVTGLSFLA